MHPVSTNSSRGAFTLLETLAAITILGVLAVLFFPNARDFLLRAGEAGCMANMRSITVALHGHLQDHQNVWPQGPSLNEELAWEKFWLEALTNYGIVEKTWQCPSFNSALASKGIAHDERSKIHYVPTMFPAQPGSATQWATHPWLIERANVHRDGPHICFPDGSIKSFNKILAEQGAR